VITITNNLKLNQFEIGIFDRINREMSYFKSLNLIECNFSNANNDSISSKEENKLKTVEALFRRPTLESKVKYDESFKLDLWLQSTSSPDQLFTVNLGKIKSLFNKLTRVNSSEFNNKDHLSSYFFSHLCAIYSRPMPSLSCPTPISCQGTSDTELNLTLFHFNLVIDCLNDFNSNSGKI
jgi:hypothetical protein